ncbi:MAG: GTPase [Candidatus Lokiarchaeota archaeon]|nr:GTPase [Candidatus Lokiarchaeota archaeon]
MLFNYLFYMLFNYVIGPAGSGKSTLVNALYNHISEIYNEISIITLNLDPGAQILPYTPHIDVRDLITLEQVMKQFKLGPNGGLIAATDLIIDFIDDLKFEISEYNDPEIVLIDTPGQMELFAFRATGPLVASSLGYGNVQRVTSFLFDPTICRQPNGFISTMLLSASVQYRFMNIPQVNILSKIDSVEREIIERTIKWSEDYNSLENATAKAERGLIREMSTMLTQMFENLGSLGELIGVSSVNNEGIDKYWGALQRITNFDESPYY